MKPIFGLIIINLLFLQNVSNAQ
ncbi:MAG: hypothetical protein JWP37_140, partial [Mucilaginibacter sp.]|nr:hypothetical protein [Mucilaginibacter sp.]